MVTPFELFLLGVALFLLLSIVMQKCGIKVYQQKDDIQIIDKPHQ